MSIRHIPPTNAKSSLFSLSGCFWVKAVNAEPRRLLPSDATQKSGQPTVSDSASQPSITNEMSRAWASASSRLQVPDIMKGRDPAACLLSDTSGKLLFPYHNFQIPFYAFIALHDFLYL
jgi:hypothetical protein